MKLEPQITQEWKQLYEHGDITEISKEGIRRDKVALAVKEGVGKIDVLEKVAKFYERKKKRQAKFVNDNMPY